MRLQPAWHQAALLLAVAATPVAAQGSSCRGLTPREPRIEVRVEPDLAPRISAVPREVIRRHAAGPGRVTTGLTTTQIEGRAGYNLARARRPDGTICVALEEVRGELANREVEILIDAKYREGSCEHAAVLGHEHEHVRINAAALREGEGILRRQLAAATRPWASRWVLEPEGEAINAAIGRAIDAAVARIRATAAARHAGLDTPQSYARTQRRCEDW